MMEEVKGDDSSGKFLFVEATGWFKEVEAKPDEQNSYLHQLQNAVEGYIECVPCWMDEHIDIWINEEGKLEGLKYNHAATVLSTLEGDDLLVGNAIVTQTDDEGNKIPLSVIHLAALRAKLVGIGFREEVA